MKKRWFLIGLIILLLVASGAIYAKFAGQARAANQGDLDGIDLHLLLEASADNGATWHNTAGTDNPGNETLNINPGATVLFRVKVWNDGEGAAGGVQILGEVEDAEYVTEAEVTDNQLGDHPFDGFDIENGGQGEVEVVNIDSNQNDGYEGVQGSITFGHNFPNGQTIINGAVWIHDYTVLGFRNNQFIRLAHAQGVNHFSLVRLVVNRAHASTGVKPTPTPSPSPSASAIATLPSTGGSIDCTLLEDLKNWWR
jgi:hypothetical protein